MKCIFLLTQLLVLFHTYYWKSQMTEMTLGFGRLTAESYYVFSNHESCIMFCRASDFKREYDGACVQMRMSYSAAAQFLLFFVQWSDCHFAGALGLLRILIYKVGSFCFSMLI